MELGVGREAGSHPNTSDLGAPENICQIHYLYVSISVYS